VVEDDDAQRMSIAALVGSKDVEVTAVGTADAALDANRRAPLRLRYRRSRPAGLAGRGPDRAYSAHAGGANLPTSSTRVQDLTRSKSSAFSASPRRLSSRT
jgi:CheY-like chemotaxis protein